MPREEPLHLRPRTHPRHDDAEPHGPFHDPEPGRYLPPGWVQPPRPGEPRDDERHVHLAARRDPVKSNDPMNTRTRFASSRRRFLGGSAVALGLPFLESLIPRAARAQL